MALKVDRGRIKILTDEIFANHYLDVLVKSYILGSNEQSKAQTKLLLRKTKIDLIRVLLELVPGGLSVATDASCEQIIHNARAAEFLRIKEFENFSHSSRVTPSVKVFSRGRELSADEMPIQQAVLRDAPIKNELEFLWEDGVRKFALWHARPFLYEGIIVGVIASFEEITQQKVSEEKLLKQANLLNLSHNYVIVRDKDNAITFWNRSAESGYGWSSKEAIGKITHDLLKTQFPTSYEDVQNQLITKGYWEGELIHTRKDGTQLIVDSRQSVIKDKFGNPTEFLETNRDITQRKKMEQGIARLDRLDLVAQMAAGIGHEVRNPMTTVRGFLQLLSIKKEFSEQKGCFSLMIEELDRANAIVTEYLSVAKDKPIILTMQNLNEIVKNITSLIQAEATLYDKAINLELEEVPEILMDENDIKQLIVNLVRNGLEAMPSGGNILIKTFMNQEEVVLSVHDEGCGIPKDVINKIGVPFFTTKDTGTGLGLAVCYSIAERHNAEIDIKTSSTGTTFVIRFKSVI